MGPFRVEAHSRYEDSSMRTQVTDNGEEVTRASGPDS
jgi:hypothetical protein